MFFTEIQDMPYLVISFPENNLNHSLSQFRPAGIPVQDHSRSMSD